METINYYKYNKWKELLCVKINTHNIMYNFRNNSMI